MEVILEFQPMTTDGQNPAPTCIDLGAREPVGGRGAYFYAGFWGIDACQDGGQGTTQFQGDFRGAGCAGPGCDEEAQPSSTTGVCRPGRL